jgi:hypothetical protein
METLQISRVRQPERSANTSLGVPIASTPGGCSAQVADLVPTLHGAIQPTAEPSEMRWLTRGCGSLTEQPISPSH